MIDVKSAAHRYSLLVEEIPLHYRCLCVGLLKRAHKVAGQIEHPDRARARQVCELDDMLELIEFVLRFGEVGVGNDPYIAKQACRFGGTEFRGLR